MLCHLQIKVTHWECIFWQEWLVTSLPSDFWTVALKKPFNLAVLSPHICNDSYSRKLYKFGDLTFWEKNKIKWNLKDPRVAFWFSLFYFFWSDTYLFLPLIFTSRWQWKFLYFLDRSEFLQKIKKISISRHWENLLPELKIIVAPW